MKRHIIYTFAALALVLSCNRAEPEQQSGDLIRIGATIADVPSTKALLNKADLKGGTVNPEVKIYDDLTDFVGTITVGNQTYVGTATQPVNVNYINDTMVWSEGQGENATWNFNSGIAWRWTRTGIHHFYGWLTKDPAGLQNNGTGTAATFNESTKVLSVPAITFTKDTPQFDFSYSDIVTKDVNSGISAAESVNLPLRHLFSALAVSIQNGGNDVAHINSVALVGLRNSKSATVGYSGSTPVVNMAVAGEDTPYLTTLADPLTLNPGGSKYDLVTGSSLVSGAKAHPYLMWPQTPEEVYAMKIVVTYSLDGVYVEGSDTELAVFTKDLLLKDTGYFGTEENKLGMDAGKKYYLNLQFKAKSIDLQLVVMPWDYTEYDLDFSASSISAKSDAPNEGVLWMETLTYDAAGNEVWHLGSRETREVTLASDRKVRGSFYIGSPHSGSWQVTTYTTPAGYEDRFRVEPSSGEITNELITTRQGYVTFFIYPNGPVDAQVKLHFNVAFRFNGETQWRDGNTEFNRKDWKVVREP